VALHCEQKHEQGKPRESVYADQKAAMEDDLNSPQIVKKQTREGKRICAMRMVPVPAGESVGHLPVNIGYSNMGFASEDIS